MLSFLGLRDREKDTRGPEVLQVRGSINPLKWGEPAAYTDSQKISIEAAAKCFTDAAYNCKDGPQSSSKSSTPSKFRTALLFVEILAQAQGAVNQMSNQDQAKVSKFDTLYADLAKTPPQALTINAAGFAGRPFMQTYLDIDSFLGAPISTEIGVATYFRNIIEDCIAFVKTLEGTVARDGNIDDLRRQILLVFMDYAAKHLRAAAGAIDGEMLAEILYLREANELLRAKKPYEQGLLSYQTGYTDLLKSIDKNLHRAQILLENESRTVYSVERLKRIRQLYQGTLINILEVLYNLVSDQHRHVPYRLDEIIQHYQDKQNSYVGSGPNFFHGYLLDLLGELKQKAKLPTIEVAPKSALVEHRGKHSKLVVSIQANASRFTQMLETNGHKQLIPALTGDVLTAVGMSDAMQRGLLASGGVFSELQSVCSGRTVLRGTSNEILKNAPYFLSYVAITAQVLKFSGQVMESEAHAEGIAGMKGELGLCHEQQENSASLLQAMIYVFTVLKTSSERLIESGKEIASTVATTNVFVENFNYAQTHGLKTILGNLERMIALTGEVQANLQRYADQSEAVVAEYEDHVKQLEAGVKKFRQQFDVFFIAAQTNGVNLSLTNGSASTTAPSLTASGSASSSTSNVSNVSSTTNVVSNLVL